MKSELDLFSGRVVQTSILKTEEVAYKPVSPLTKQPTVIEFLSLGSGDTYRDLNISIKVTFRVVKDEKDTLHTDDSGGFVNNILHSMFRQATIYLNGKPIAQMDVNYNYRAYIEVG